MSPSFFSSPRSSAHSSNSCSSNSCHLSSPPAPSSPLHCSSAVPFSWEKQPGVPKQVQGSSDRQRGSGQRLPLPPPLRSNSEPSLSIPRKKRTQLAFIPDPFALALMECSKADRCDRSEGDDLPRLYSKGMTAATASSKIIGRRRRTAAGLLGFPDFYSSCKTTCSVADSTVLVPRSGRGMAAPHSFLSRRGG
ncbi:unnamed protein product [Spirodela intermedia]|uniref:Uncharacterized protein n=1 Tax=Spirodela intermedia TaxID=51605 RepID=A0A7I8IR93_SPIIN|nr:unnamed protein product [Spirodela intermedia]CAA6660461.1 unnamed protein product [Spirodela intermedia]